MLEVPESKHSAQRVAFDPQLPSALPFDVEIHQLADGQRVVLDMHRLLIPDLRWNDWMQQSDEAAPLVQAISFGDQAAQSVV